MEEHDKPTRWRRWGVAAALVGSGVLAGGVLAGTLTAGAETATPNAESSQSAGAGTVDESKSQRPDEQLLTGDTAAKVREAALAQYPGAKIQRVETDSDGVYEAHLTTADGQRVTVEVGEDFAVTGTESRPGHGGRPPSSEGGATPQTS